MFCKIIQDSLHDMQWYMMYISIKFGCIYWYWLLCLDYWCPPACTFLQLTPQLKTPSSKWIRLSKLDRGGSPCRHKNSRADPTIYKYPYAKTFPQTKSIHGYFNFIKLKNCFWGENCHHQVLHDNIQLPQFIFS